MGPVQEGQLSTRSTPQQPLLLLSPVRPLPARFSSLLRTDHRSLPPALPADSTVPFPSTPSLWGLGILKRPPASHLPLISWAPQALDWGRASPFLLSLLPLGQSQDTGQLFYGKGSSGQHIPSKPRACILAFELCNMGTPLSPRSSPVIKRAELPA